MYQLTTSVEAALSSHNWETALSLALALPDIAGRVEHPELGSGRRYARWFDEYVGPKYRNIVGGQPHVFLCGDDCYALRCAYLHEGSTDISNQRAQKRLDGFNFSQPTGRERVHCNEINNRLQLQVDLFCQDMVDGVHQWIDSISDPEKMVQIEKFMRVVGNQNALRVPPRPSPGYGFDPETGIFWEK